MHTYRYALIVIDLCGYLLEPLALLVVESYGVVFVAFVEDVIHRNEEGATECEGVVLRSESVDIILLSTLFVTLYRTVVIVVAHYCIYGNAQPLKHLLDTW